MKRHLFDPVSFFFGILFAALATWALFVEEIETLDGRWVWPGLLILGGVALLAPLFTHRRQPEPVAADPSLEAARAELPDDPFGNA